MTFKSLSYFIFKELIPFIFISCRKELSSPPKIVISRKQVLESRLYLTSRDEGYYENLRNKFLANM